MNTERQLMKAELADAKNEFEKISILADCWLISIRTRLNPYAGDITELNIEKAAVEMGELTKNHADLKRLKEKIKKLDEALNG